MVRHFSLILLPTLACNAECSYCFEAKSDHNLSLDQLATIIRKVMDHLDRYEIESLSIYWQGGEIMTLPPEWLEESVEIIQRMADKRGKQVYHFLQSNMLAYSAKWSNVLANIFGNSVGSSMDFPNLHRKLKGGSTKEYTEIWTRNVKKAAAAGIKIGVIAIPNEETLKLGAESFYSYFVDEIGIHDFQINTPFPGGSPNQVKKGFPLEHSKLAGFLLDLAKIWSKRGLQNGVKIGPFSNLSSYFLCGSKDFACIWRDNCANEFVCIDPRGFVAQCDCWVTSYPLFRFGNILEGAGLTELLLNSQSRQKLQSRPGMLIQKEDCLQCDYLAICHGGCPVRAFTVYGDVHRKDPYCELYRSLFQAIQDLVSSCPPIP